MLYPFLTFQEYGWDRIWLNTSLLLPFQFSLGDSERAPEEGALRNLPTGSTATLGLTGVAIGVAYAALDNFRERLATKLRLGAMRSSWASMRVTRSKRWSEPESGGRGS